jgi:Tfp pilus assembly protein PilF
MYPEAIATLRKAIDVRSQDYNDEFVSDMYSIIGDVYHSMGNNRASVEAYDSALVYNSSNILVLNNYAYNITVDGGDLEKAEDMSYRTIKAEPENITYLDTYMWILFKQGRYSEAKAYAEKLLSIETDALDKVLLHHCGDVFAKCGEMERALELWQLAVDAGDDSKILKKKIKRKKYYSDGKKR